MVYLGSLCDFSKASYGEQRQKQTSKEKRDSEKVDGPPEELKGMVS